MVDNSVKVMGGKWLEKNNTLTVIPYSGSKPRSDVENIHTADAIVDFLILSFPKSVFSELQKQLKIIVDTISD